MFDHLELEEWVGLGRKVDAELASYFATFARVRRAEDALRKSGRTPPGGKPSFLPAPHAAGRLVLSDARNTLLGLAALRQGAERYAALLDKAAGVGGLLRSATRHDEGGKAVGGKGTKPTVKLVGEDGNAFAILGRCRLAAKEAGWTKAMIDEFARKVMRGDYGNVLAVCMEYFDVE